MAQWNKEWREALSGTWLSDNDQAPGAEAAELVTPTATFAPTPTPTPIEVAEVLSTLDELSVLLTKHNDAQIALASIEDSRVRYVQEVSQIAESLKVPVDLDNPLTTADVLRKQLVDAQTNARRKAELAEEVKQLKSQLSSEQALKQQSHSVFAEMSAIFPAKDFDGLLAIMRRGEERERALATRAAAQTQLGNLLGLAEFGEAKQLLQTRLSDSSAIDALNVEHAAAVADSTNLNDEVARLFHAWRGAEEALSAIGDDGEVARLNEQYRVLLLDIEADTQRFIALSAGTLAVERALRAYVDTHRSSLLARASSAFATITRGAFTGLDAMPGIAGQSKEELVGTRVDGSTTSATQMSRGSRFQLYLSLRIAGYHEFVAQREPLPFFADDILETFDDDRSAETFSLMADMAKHGQVIYLTHHQHLCEIARQVTNGRVKIHELPARSLHDLTHA